MFKKIKMLTAGKNGTAVRGVVLNTKGLTRKNNEDNFCFNGRYMRLREMDESAFLQGSCGDVVQLYAICDGMGGADAGEAASCRAVKELALEKRKGLQEMDPEKLTSVLQRISDRISEEASQKALKSGTTVALVLIRDGRMMLANVGDSRIYRFRGDKLAQMSLDHTKIQKMLAMGLITPEKVKTSPVRHVITQYLGMPSGRKVAPHIISEEELCKNDIYVLCSDGLTDMLEDSEIEAVLQKRLEPRETAMELLKAALDNGGRDNLTVMLLYIS